MQLLLWQYQFSGGRAGFEGTSESPNQAWLWAAVHCLLPIVFVFGSLLAARLSEIRLLFARV